MRLLLTLLRLLCTLLGLLLLAVSFTPLDHWGVSHMAVDWYEGDADILVVLGGAMLVAGNSPHAAMGSDSYLRCTYALWQWDRHHYRYLVVSGPDGLAEAMAKYLEANGVKPQQILLETAARTTQQNAEFVKNILDHQPGLPPHPTIAVLTSDYHSQRAQLVFLHLGMQVRMVPVPDVAKRGGFVLTRWDAFLDLADEVLKDGFYKLTGKT